MPHSRAEARLRSHSSGHMNMMCVPSPQLLVESDPWMHTVKDLLVLPVAAATRDWTTAVVTALVLTARH